MKEVPLQDEKKRIISAQVGSIVESAPEAEHGETVRGLVEKGFVNDAREGEEFVKTLRETLGASREVGKELGRFEESFNRIISDAETHLADLENYMKGSFEDRSIVFRQIAKQLAENFDEVIRSEKRGPYKPNVARRFANFVLRNKAALMAVTVFTAVLRLGGGVAHAAETHPYDAGHSFEGHFSDGNDAGEGSVVNHSESGHPDSGRDFQQICDQMKHFSAESDGQPDAESIHTQIEHMHSLIENGEGGAEYVVVDQKSGDIDGTFDMHRLQEEMRTEGSVRLSVRSYSEIHISETNGSAEERFESVFSVGQVHEATGSHDHGSEEGLKMSSEGRTPEEAALHAINELSEYMGVHVSNEMSSETVEDGAFMADRTTSHTVTAGSHVIDISAIEVTEQKTVDGDGHLNVMYTATVFGYGI
jgi:hypothetical protein